MNERIQITERPAEKGRCRRAFLAKIDGEWLLHRGTYIIEFNSREAAETAASAILARRAK